jgi:hypothetical protein
MRFWHCTPWVVALVVGAGCRQPPAPLPLDLEVAGCNAVEIAPGKALGCELADTARLRIYATKTDLHAYVDGAVHAFVSHTRDHDREIYAIEVPEKARELRLETTEGSARYTHALAFVHGGGRRWLEEARALRERGDLDGVDRALAPHLTSADATERALAGSLHARTELARGRIGPALDAFRASIAAHRALGRVSDAVDDGLALVYSLVQRSHGYAEARTRLTELQSLAERTSEGRARLPYYRALLEAEVGDRRAALAQFDEAERKASAIDLTRLVRNTKNARAVELQLLGRFDEARAALGALEMSADKSDAGRCERAEIAINIGYGALREAEGAFASGRPSAGLLGEARAALERAVTLAADQRCPDPHLRGIALGNLAWAQYRSGALPEAERSLADARRAVSEPRGTERLFWMELEALLARARSNAEAQRIFERIRDEARVFQLREAEWSALTGLAATLIPAGKRNEARAQLLDAETLLDELALLVPLGMGRSAFLRDRNESTAQLIRLELDAGNPAAALDAARRARGRVLASVRAALRAERLSDDERRRREHAIEGYRAARDEAETARGNDWAMSRENLARAERGRAAREGRMRAAVDEAFSVLGVQRERALTPLDPHATTLSLEPTREGVLLFVARASGKSESVVTSRIIAPPTADVPSIAHALAAALEGLAPLEPRIRVLADPFNVDFGALPVRGRPLGAQVAIEHSLDLGGAAASATPAPSPLVVSDPLSDLPTARIEGTKVFGVVAGANVKNPLLLEGRDATAKRVRSALEGATFFHYAGHAVYAGHEGWDSHLRLADGGRLDLADILTLSRVPRRIVLSSCEAASAGDARESRASGGFGLAQAFVVAGAEVAIAPVRPVHDATMLSFATALATELADRTADPSGALLRALQRAGTEMAADDRWAFRLVRP